MNYEFSVSLAVAVFPEKYSLPDTQSEFAIDDRYGN